MLSDYELRVIRNSLAKNLPKSAERNFKNKLIEHDYASKYPPFRPLPHHRIFLNRATDEKTLHRIIDTAKTSEIILLDTESTTAHRQPNEPALIQLELIPDHDLPVVIITEVHHLPRTDSNQFALMKKIFRIVLDSEKIIYTWGLIDELKPFAATKLFDIEQIDNPENENLQEIFKTHWQQLHGHENNNSKCICEKCLGKKSNQPWKLLDAIAYQLNEWLDKRHTCSPFNIGLDPRLEHFNEKQLAYRKTLANYAANDVLSMERLMIDMQERSSNEKPIHHPVISLETPKKISMNMGDPNSIILLIDSSLSVDSPIRHSQYAEAARQEHIDHQIKNQTIIEHYDETMDNQRIIEEKRKRNRISQDQLERDRIEQNRTEQDRLERKRIDQQRIERDRIERDRIDRNQIESERIEQRLIERNRILQDRLERDRIDDQNRVEQELIERKRIEQQLIERNRILRNRIERNRIEQDQIVNARMEQDRIEKNQINLEETERNQLNHFSRQTEKKKCLDETERKRRNRIRTIKQRQRHFKNEIIRRNIDPRFSISVVKGILRKNEIPFTAIQIAKSPTTGQTSLYIGIQNASDIQQYQRRATNLFTMNHYNEFNGRY